MKQWIHNSLLSMITTICLEIHACIYANYTNKGNFYITMSPSNPTNHIPIKGGNLQPRSKLYIISDRIFLQTVKNSKN